MIKKNVIILFGLILASLFLTGCIPPNENVGKPGPNNYKDGYYGGYYNGGYYYR